MSGRAREIIAVRPRRYVNLETGLRRMFLFPPKRGRWKLIAAAIRALETKP